MHIFSLYTKGLLNRIIVKRKESIINIKIGKKLSISLLRKENALIIIIIEVNEIKM